jgi:hypothetical protein
MTPLFRKIGIPRELVVDKPFLSPSGIDWVLRDPASGVEWMRWRVYEQSGLLHAVIDRKGLESEEVERVQGVEQGLLRLLGATFYSLRDPVNRGGFVLKDTATADTSMEGSGGALIAQQRAVPTVTWTEWKDVVESLSTSPPPVCIRNSGGQRS